MNKLYYVRFYSHSLNYQQRFLWTAKSREELDLTVNEYTSESSYRAEVIRFICDTPDEVAEEL